MADKSGVGTLGISPFVEMATIIQSGTNYFTILLSSLTKVSHTLTLKVEKFKLLS